MGVLGELRDHDTKMRGTTLLDEAGTETGRLPAEVFAGELEVPKQQLTRILHRITVADVEYVFDDSISTLTQDDTGVTVEFERATTQRFDLVVGADGVYSKVRQLAFGPHSDAVQHVGMSGAGFTAANHLGLDHSGVLRQTKSTAIYASHRRSASTDAG